MARLVVAVVASAVLLAGCGGGTTTGPRAGQGSGTSEAAPTQPTTGSPTAPASARGGTAVKTAGSQFGQILFDGTGQAIYLFDKEKSATPECYTACAAAWPPVLTQGDPVATADVGADKLATTSRTDGSVQVTYAGHPLYYYAHEGKNEVRCHNVREFGGLWLVVTPAGTAAPH
jgi:predicted lipoprotein with Yx(FWY)xxD motif